MEYVTSRLWKLWNGPTCHLIAELKSDGQLKFDPKLVADLLSTIDGLEVAIISVVEDHLDDDVRMTDFVRDLLKAAENPEAGPRKEQFSLPGKNGILMQAKPIVLDTNRVTLYTKKPIKKHVYLMSICIGDRNKLDDVGFTKLADFLYFASSYVIHSTHNLNQPDTTKRFLWRGSYAHSIKGKAFGQICFMFFNWRYGHNQAMSAFSRFGLVNECHLVEWATRPAVAAACKEILDKFQYSQVYCFDAMENYKMVNINDLRSILNHHDFQFELRPTMLPSKNQLQKFVDNINKHNYFNPVSSGPAPSTLPSYPRDHQQYQSKPSNQYGRRKPNHVEKKQILAQAVNNYRFYFDNLFADVPTTDTTKLAQYHMLAVSQIECGFTPVDSTLNAQLQSEWNRITQCLVQVDLELVNLESEFVLLLLSSDTSKEELISFIGEARKKLQLLNKPLDAQNNGINPYVTSRCSSLLDKMVSIVEALAGCNKDLSQVKGYIPQESIIKAHDKAAAKFTDGTVLDSIAKVVLDNMCNLIKIQNDSLKQKAMILASEARQAAMEEYCKSVDRLMEKAVYSRASLEESHGRVVKAIVDTFSDEDYQNEVWQDMVKNLKAELEAHVSTLLERNWINSKAAFERYENIMAFAIEIYQDSLGSDYKNFSGKRKQRVHDDARRSALDAFRDKVTAEPQAWISQWYQDVYDRIELESPSTTLAATVNPLPAVPMDELMALDMAPNDQLTEGGADGTPMDTDVGIQEDGHPFVDPEEERLKQLLKSCIAEMEAKFVETELSRFVKLSVRKAMDDAKQVLEADEPSAQKLKLTLSKLNVRRPCLDLLVVAVD